MTESEIQTRLADYIKLKYPYAIFHSDFGSGVKLTMSQAVRQKRQNGGRRAWPDIFIAMPMLANMSKLDMKEMYKDYLSKYPNWNTGQAMMIMNNFKHGLFIELKKDGTRIFKKDGSLVKNEHIQEQYEMLCNLQDQGYEARFAVGFEEAKKMIDKYMSGDFDF